MIKIKEMNNLKDTGGGDNMFNPGNGGGGGDHHKDPGTGGL